MGSKLHWANGVEMIFMSVGKCCILLYSCFSEDHCSYWEHFWISRVISRAQCRGRDQRYGYWNIEGTRDCISPPCSGSSFFFESYPDQLPVDLGRGILAPL